VKLSTSLWTSVGNNVQDLKRRSHCVPHQRVAEGVGFLKFGCVNIGSLLSKLDDVMEVTRDHRLDLLLI
jgi:hypothetical protein